MPLYLGNQEISMLSGVPIITQGIDTTDADAVASDILLGKTAYVNDKKITGICSFDANTSDADATASEIASGKTAYVNGAKIIGTNTFDADTRDGTCTENNMLAGVVGYANGQRIVGAGDANLDSANILNGISIFGVNGSVIPLSQYVRYGKYVPASNLTTITINHGLGVIPTFVVVWLNSITVFSVAAVFAQYILSTNYTTSGGYSSNVRYKAANANTSTATSAANITSNMSVNSTNATFYSGGSSRYFVANAEYNWLAFKLDTAI